MIQLMDFYVLPDYETPEEFFTLLAQRLGKLKKGGRVLMEGAARRIIHDWTR